MRALNPDRKNFKYSMDLCIQVQEAIENLGTVFQSPSALVWRKGEYWLDIAALSDDDDLQLRRLAEVKRETEKKLGFKISNELFIHALDNAAYNLPELDFVEVPSYE